VKNVVFEFQVRGISKTEIQKLYKKYSKLLKRKSDNHTEIVCQMLLELLYLYFNNDKEKLYKLFYPVIMANLIEKGSIHSVIEEFGETKKLYSWSYTYRILNQLDEDTGLEIGRIFRKTIFKILKKTGFKSKGFCVAIDITAKPFYGNKNLFMVKGSKRKAGTNYAIQYLTASIIEEGVRFNLLCLSITSLSSLTRKFHELINEIRRIIPIKLLFLDRAFGNKTYSKILKFLGHKFIMPITRNYKLKELEYCIKEQSVLAKDEHDIVILDYIFNEDKPKEYQENVKLIILHDQRGVIFFITNVYNINMKDAYDLCQVYKYRFGIETNYRVDNIFSPFTCSIKATLRYLLMQISLVVQDLWTFLNFLSHKGDWKQPREKYKSGYSVADIVRARIKDLDFIWRPLITAVMFKRTVEKIF
jgi:hypothetical protein